jgi:DNA-binding MarR family transcriptional regulator
LSVSETGSEEIARLVMEVLPRLMRLIGSTVPKTEEGLGFRSVTQLHVMKHLTERAWLVSELAQEMRLSVPTVSVAVDSLVRRGLVERGETSTDRRTNPLSLTPDGIQCWQTAREHAIAVLGQVLGQISDPERASLIQGMAAVARVLDSVSSGTPVCLPKHLHSKELVP